MARKLSVGLGDFGLSSGSKNLAKFNINTTYRIRSQITSSISPNGLARALDRAFINALSNISDKLDTKLREAITSDIWLTNEGTSDIYESGRLLGSQEVTLVDSGISISYGVPYANLIHYGGYITPYGNESSKKVYIPPRPWITAVVNGEYGIIPIDYEQIIYAALREVI